MGHALHDLVRHNNWATSQVIATCESLTPEQLSATVPGTFGSVMETLTHLIDAEMGYLFRLTGFWRERPWNYDEAVSLETAKTRAAFLAEAWERFLLLDSIDTERIGEARGDDEVFAVRAGIFFTQAIHHANEHRAHICTIVGSLGLEAPDVSGWGYALASGRSWVVASGESRVPSSE